MTGCELSSAVHQLERLCQVIDQLLVLGLFFREVNQNFRARALSFGKKQPAQKQPAISPSLHTSSVNEINEGCSKSDGASDKCLSERGNMHFKQQKEAGLEDLGFITF